MSAILAFLRPTRAWLLVDSVATAIGDDTPRPCPKAFYLPHLGAVVTSRGLGIAMPMLHLAIEQDLPADFDGLMTMLPDAWSDVEFRTRTPEAPGLQVILIGWSPRHRQMTGMSLRTRGDTSDQELLPLGQLIAAPSFDPASWPGLAQVSRTGLVCSSGSRARALSCSAGEFHENEIRKDFTPSERVAIERAINAEIERQQGRKLPQDFAGSANDRVRDESSRLAGFGERRGRPSEKSAANAADIDGRTDDRVAKAVGFGSAGKVSIAAAQIEPRNSIPLLRERRLTSRAGRAQSEGEPTRRTNARPALTTTRSLGTEDGYQFP